MHHIRGGGFVVLVCVCGRVCTGHISEYVCTHTPRLIFKTLKKEKKPLQPSIATPPNKLFEAFDSKRCLTGGVTAVSCYDSIIRSRALLSTSRQDSLFTVEEEEEEGGKKSKGLKW